MTCQSGLSRKHDIMSSKVGSGFMGTRLSLARPINDYGKVQRLISSVIRNRRSFWLPLSSPLYLNIGCGSKIRNEFYNIDYDWVPGIDRCIDLESVGLEFPNGHVAGVFSEHCFEHLSFGTVSQIFRDLHRLLKPGGCFSANCTRCRTPCEALHRCSRYRAEPGSLCGRPRKGGGLHSGHVN